MRSLKWISIVVFFCLLLSCSATFAAEDNSFEEIEYIDEADAASSDDESVDDFVEEIAPFELDSTPDDNDYFEPTTDFSDQTIPKNSNTDIPLSAPKSGGDFEIDEEGTLVRYKGFDKKVVIPSSVKTIGREAFKNNEIMESISIPSSVTYIDDLAFSHCTALKNIAIPNSVTAIHYGTFENCSSLTSVQLPKKLTYIGSTAFWFCPRLKTITLPNGIEYIAMCTFSYCDSLESITLPSSVTSINENAFSDCKNLTSVTIPSSVTTIDYAAFKGSDNVIIYGTAGSYAEKYAKGKGIPFIVGGSPLAPTGVKLNQTAVTMGVKESLNLKATLSPAKATSKLTWSSSNPKIASVDQNGRITAVKKGTAVITVTTANKKTAKATITVKPQPKKVKLNKKGTVKIRQGNTLTLKAKIAKTSATTLTWTSSNPKVAKVDQNGKVTGVSKGKATITVKAYNGKKASVKIKVLPPEPTDVKISASTATMKVKQKMTLSALLTPNNAESKIKWKSSNKKIATVNKIGVVTAKKKGKVVITAITANKKKATCTIVVN